ncbi:MAG: hypothetical protein ABSG03_07810 [Bryobacteraceae bacterium]|jgi:hypothetical protein
MRTLPLLLVLAAASCALSPQDTPGTSARPSGGFAVQLSSRLNASSQSDLDQQLTAAFTEGTAHPANVRNCVEMLALGARGAGSTADPEYLQQRSTLVQCTVLQALRGAKPASSSFVAALKWDESILPLLPPQLAINVSDESIRAADAAAKANKSWADIDKTATAGADGPDRVMVKGEGFIVRLILWGRGDLNGDGVQDLLVQTLDTLTEGTYRYTRLFILTRKSADGKLSVVRELL